MKNQKQKSNKMFPRSGIVARQLELAELEIATGGIKDVFGGGVSIGGGAVACYGVIIPTLVD